MSGLSPTRKQFALGLTAVLLFIAAGPLRVWWASGTDDILQRSVQLADSRADADTTYNFAFHLRTTPTVGSIRFQFCSNDPLPDAPCTAPSGFTAANAKLTYQQGNEGMSVAPGQPDNVLLLTRPSAAAASADTVYTFANMHNPSAGGTYYIRVQLYASEDASGQDVAHAGLAYVIDTSININTYVPPYLIFCMGNQIKPYDCASATGNFINYGELSTTQTRTGQTQLLAATNADGYTIQAFGQSLTSGNNVIAALATSDVSRPGVDQFGLNLRANQTPKEGQDVQGGGQGSVASAYDVPDFFHFVSGDVLASASRADDYRLYTASYIVNIAKDQPPGVYVTTINYVSLANY